MATAYPWAQSVSAGNNADTTTSVKTGFQNNTGVPTKVNADNGSTNFYYNNANLDFQMQQDYISTVMLNMIKQESQLAIYDRFASRQITLPKRAGTNSVRLMRLRDLSVVISPLREGQLPQKLTWSGEKVSVSLAPYAAYIEFTDTALERNNFDILGVYTTRLIESARKTLEYIARESLYLGASKAYVGDATSVADINGAKNYALTLDDLENVVYDMSENGFVEGVNGDRFVVLLGIDGVMELQRDERYERYAQHQTMAPVTRAPWEPFLTISNLEFVQIPRSAKKIDNACVAFVIGKDAYVCVGFEGGSTQPEIIYKPLGSAGSADPINQKATVAYKIDGFGVAVINPVAIVALHYASASSAVDREPARGYRDSTGKWIASKVFKGTTFDSANPKVGALLGNTEIDMTTIWDGTLLKQQPFLDLHQDAMTAASASKVNIFGDNENPKADPTLGTGTVTPPATVDLNPTPATVTLKVADDQDVSVGAAGTITASSSDDTIASVVVSGRTVRITGEKVGTATITISGTNATADATVAVTVS